MQNKAIKKNVVLGILFFLPVIFLLFLFPAKHNYNVLDSVGENVMEIVPFAENSTQTVTLEDNITVLGFFGSKPLEKSTAALNLSQMIYGKFKGFKRFQIVILVSQETEESITKLKQEIGKYDDLKYWHFVESHPQDITKVFESLNVSSRLDENYATDDVFIVDKERNLRGRLDDRTDKEIEKNANPYALKGYDCISIDVLKNKMSDDMRVLFTEYRQKRKGNFDSSARRADDLKQNNEQEN